MAGAGVVREPKSDLFPEVRNGPPTTLTARAEMLEHGLENMRAGANEAVSETVEAVTDMVGTSARAVGKAVEGATQEMANGAAETANAIGCALDLPRHVARAPWLMMAGALLLGAVAGTLVGRWRRRSTGR
jgi:hypothetical protein